MKIKLKKFNKGDKETQIQDQISNKHKMKYLIMIKVKDLKEKVQILVIINIWEVHKLS